MGKQAIIPKPLELKHLKGSFEFSQKVVIVAAKGFEPEAHFLADWLGLELAGKAEKGSRAIRLELSKNKKRFTDEGYGLEVSPEVITIEAATRAGIFYGAQTLRQLYLSEKSESVQAVKLACLSIYDKPRFSWRGLMLDVSRHFMPLDFIKRLLDALAFHKLNVFHWHLTDDQGWRIEIKKYPELTKKGAYRASTLIGHSNERPRIYDDTPHGGFYTQDEIREIVVYAAERHIRIVPEIDMPGHMQAAIACYPELGNLKAQLEPRCHWGISQHILNTEPQTLQFAKDVLEEVMELFPADFIHVGGDEALKHEWEESRQIQDHMLKLGLRNEEELQSWFIAQMADVIAAKGRRLIGWDEILEGGLSQNASVMSWRGVQGGIDAAKAGHDVVMSPTSHVYLDYYQAKRHEREPLAIGGYLPLKQVYAFDPMPAELNTAKRKHILGGQANLWTEYIPTPEHAEYMLFPRLCALAECVWTELEGKNFRDFSQRLAEHVKRLDELEINYRELD